jgi:predicted nucleotidyltransferase
MNNSSIHQLNRIEMLAIQALLERLAQTFPDQILATTLFGSKARGDDNAESDIDILVITASEDWQVARTLRQIGARVSLERDVLFNIHVIAHDRWAEMEQIRSTYWRNIQRDGIQLLPQAA